MEAMAMEETLQQQAIVSVLCFQQTLIHNSPGVAKKAQNEVTV